MTDDPTIKQRLHKLLKTKRNPIKELIDHLPTESSNQELIGLHILGESKFDKERDFAKKLVEQTEKAEK